jgi:hypothetical protein
MPMNRRGFLTAFIGATAGLALAHREAMAMTVAPPHPFEPELQPDAAILSEDEHARMSVEEARLRRYRRVVRPRRRVIVRRYIVRPRRYHWNRGRHLGWYRRRPRRRYYYY